MNVLIKLPLTGYRPGSSANIANYVLYLLQIFFSKQWLWFSCLSGRFQHERSTVRIQSMAKIYPEQECSLNCWKGENKERERKRPSEADLIYNNPPPVFPPQQVEQLSHSCLMSIRQLTWLVDDSAHFDLMQQHNRPELWNFDWFHDRANSWIDCLAK